MTARSLHYVFKIGNRRKTHDFYTNVLKMKVLRHEEFAEGCKATCNGPYDGQWSKTMMGYGSEDEHFVIELTYNYAIGSYKLGNDLFGIYLESDEAFQHIEQHLAGNFERRACGKLMISDPDGHKFFVDKGSKARIVRASVNVVDVQKSIDYWHGELGMKIVSQNNTKMTCSMAFGDNQCVWEVRGVSPGTTIDRGTGFGRIAFAYPSDKLAALESKVKERGLPILKDMVVLETPGKANVSVIILADPDQHEICFVDDDGFRALSKMDPSAGTALQNAIEADDSDSFFPNGKRSG